MSTHQIVSNNYAGPYQLKPSRVAVIVVWGMMACLAGLFYYLLDGMLMLLCCVALLLIYWQFNKSNKVIALQALDDNLWVLQYQAVSQPRQVHILKWLDHQAYIVLYFQEAKLAPLIIWYDQVSYQQWKNLKVCANLR
ncbi:hypothetical protein [Acinetobacter larvae]|uniref:Toxin CptA n=1 Tax=Acinetobacter larvae TaxID=1789224 RepID=A0A1B2LWM8_9GAMM|nr:hypothetical protein [Acinetobacter larvae]AOA57289.1 hypothetical protein BFG52_02230 [Acinetobacter larvae]